MKENISEYKNITASGALNNIFTQKELGSLLRGNNASKKLSDNSVIEKMASNSDNKLLSQQEADAIVALSHGEQVSGENKGLTLESFLDSIPDNVDDDTYMVEAFFDSSCLEENDIELMQKFLKKYYGLDLDFEVVREYIYDVFLRLTGKYYYGRQMKEMLNKGVLRQDIIFALNNLLKEHISDNEREIIYLENSMQYILDDIEKKKNNINNAEKILKCLLDYND